MNFRLRFLLWCEIKHCNRAHQNWLETLEEAAEYSRKRDASLIRIEALNRRIRLDAAETERKFA